MGFVTRTVTVKVPSQCPVPAKFSVGLATVATIDLRFSLLRRFTSESSMRAVEVAQVIECLPSIHKALDVTPSTT